MMPLLLEKKVAVVYGMGAIGRAIALGFAREGAQVFLAARTKEKLDVAASEIRKKHPSAKVETSIVDALDEEAVERFVDGVIKSAGRIDISCNVIGVGDVQEPLMKISANDFVQPIQNGVRTQFLTTRAAARHMIGRKSGVILAFGGGGPQTLPGLGGFKVALDAMEGLRRQWTTELSEHGIRVLTIKTAGVPEGIPESFAPRAEITKSITEASPMKRVATLDDVSNVAAFLASDQARTMTGTEINISCGTLME